MKFFREDITSDKNYDELLLININYFNLVAFDLCIEDRQPNIPENEAFEQYLRKYKIKIHFKIFFNKYEFIFNTARPGYVTLNGKDLLEEKL